MDATWLPLAPGWLESSGCSPPGAPHPAAGVAAPSDQSDREPAHLSSAAEVWTIGVEYLIRPARITDIDRLAAIGQASVTAAGGTGALGGADLLRQLVYLPHASVLVAEARRELVGGAVLVLRPSVVAGGYVGTVDFLVVAPDHDAERVTDALMEELLRSASNKGCSAVETNQPDDPASLARLERNGFAPAGTLLRRPVSAAGSSSRRA